VDGYYPFACVEKLSLRMRSILLPSSVPDSGAWDDYKYSGKNGWTASLGGVLVLTDNTGASLWYAWETLLLQLRTTGLDLKFDWTDKNGFNKHAAGHALIPESGIDGVSGDFGRWDLQLQGTGALDVNGIITPPIVHTVKKLEWITTGAEPNVVQHNSLIGLNATQIYEVSWEGDDKFKVITAGVPTHKEVLLNSAAGTLTFLNNFEAYDYVRAIVENI
jgi:hypothetical protein